MNQKKLKKEKNTEDERSENNCVDTQIKHDEYIVCTKEYRRN